MMLAKKRPSACRLRQCSVCSGRGRQFLGAFCPTDPSRLEHFRCRFPPCLASIHRRTSGLAPGVLATLMVGAMAMAAVGAPLATSPPQRFGSATSLRTGSSLGWDLSEAELQAVAMRESRRARAHDRLKQAASFPQPQPKASCPAFGSPSRKVAAIPQPLRARHAERRTPWRGVAPPSESVSDLFTDYVSQQVVQTRCIHVSIQLPGRKRPGEPLVGSPLRRSSSGSGQGVGVRAESPASRAAADTRRRPWASWRALHPWQRGLGFVPDSASSRLGSRCRRRAG